MMQLIQYQIPRPRLRPVHQICKPRPHNQIIVALVPSIVSVADRGTEGRGVRWVPRRRMAWHESEWGEVLQAKLSFFVVFCEGHASNGWVGPALRRNCPIQ
jgi:hypothetical protein